jgi:lysozyme family protein
MADRFDACLDFVLKWEGGFSDDPDDPGGATNLGIIQKEYDRYRTSKGLTHQSVRHIARAEAREIYDHNYWDPTHAQFLAQPIDIVMFDTAVNNGTGTAIGFLQVALGVSVTHIFDAGTSAAYHHYLEAHSPTDLASEIVTTRIAHYKHLVVLHPKLGKFLKGWMNRVNDLKAHMG